MRFNLYVRRLFLTEWEHRKDNPAIKENDLKLYAILENIEDVRKMVYNIKKRADVLNIKVNIIPYGKNEFIATFYSAVLELLEILYDPFTFDTNTVYKTPNKPEILSIITSKDRVSFLIAVHPIEEFIEINGLDPEFSIKNLVFSQKPDFTSRDLGNSDIVIFMNKMKRLLNNEGIIISVRPGTERIPVRSFIVLLYTDKSYDEAFETFKHYSIQIEEDM